LRFEAVLREQMPRFRRARLEDPIRWAPFDPLEQSINDGLLLNCESLVPAHGKIRIERLATATLMNDDGLLRAVFGLLVTAHYQTRPADLRRLLDDPGTLLWVAFDGDLPCGVLLGLVEGGFDAEIRPAILAGTRRPRGHLLPQSLAVHAGIDGILVQRTLRVMRIAVHTSAQRRGTGRRLVNAAQAWAGEQHIDALGCAYGVEVGLLAFWMSNGLQPVRLGLRIDPASAAHSVMMLRGLSEGGRRLQATAVARFRRDLPWSLARAFRELPPEAAIALMRDRDCSDIPLDRLDRECLFRVASGARDPATAAPVVWRWLVASASRGGGRLAPLIAFHLQQWPVARVVSAFGLDGAAALEQALRDRLADELNAPSQSG
jgi:tRNA(Met) cytidine acetyltransferase